MRLHVSPVEGETAAARATVPLNPWIPETMMVEDPAVPARNVKVVGDAVTVKSWMW